MRRRAGQAERDGPGGHVEDDPGPCHPRPPERRYLRLATATATMIPAMTHSA